MTIEEIRDAIAAAGGKSFLLRMSDGTHNTVPHTDQLITSPEGSRLAFFTSAGSLKLLAVAHVTSIEFPLAKE